MAEEQPGATLSTTFPPPPPFYQHFTKANVDAVEKERPDYAQRPDDTQRSTPSRAAALAYLSPPAPPSDGRYKSFGATYDVSMSERRRSRERAAR